MAARIRPYEQFGSYVLFKKLESDALTELWRAAHIEGEALGNTIALRRFHAGNRAALVAAARAAQEAAPLLTGTSFVKTQTIDVIDNTPFVAHEYAGGRSLHHIVERARGGAGMTPNPIPTDQAIAIAEKVALSLATSSDLRYAGQRMLHGALLPQFVWISDGGEIRVGGQMLGPGIVASLRDAKVGAEMGRYFSPEYQSTGTASQASEVYALGAILYLLVTGQEPPDPIGGSAFTLTIRSARAMGGGPIPNDIRSLIEKSLALDPAARFPTAADMKKDLSALSHKYTATTFNLAFYLSALLKKELEGEAIDREKESKVSAAPYLAALATPAAAATAAAPAAAKPAVRRLPLAVAAAVAGVAVLGIGAYFVSAPKQEAQPLRAVAGGAMVPAPKPKPPVIPEPIVVGSPAATETIATVAPATTRDDDAARQKAFEAAVKQRMQEEMMKLQAQYTRDLQKQQSKNAPILTASAGSPVLQQQQAPVMEDRSISAAQLDQERRDALVDRPETTTTLLQPAQSPSVPQTQTVAPQPVVPAIREGDVVDIAEVDTAPRPLAEIHPSPPPLAIRQHVQGSVIVTVFISETGAVLDAKVLTGVTRFGVGDAALRAVRSARFSPAMKNGKRVRVWMPLRFDFKL
ncbi:MAG: TonB family protein [Thermoanaerobaculia bacterium]